jgi:hypothetical protein
MTTLSIDEQMTNLPVPPVLQESVIDIPAFPDFSFITDDSSRMCIESGYKGVQLTQGWNALRTFNCESFMFSHLPNIRRIMDAVNEQYDGGHSGASIGWTMRQLERISHVGVNVFKSEWLNDINK